MTTAATASPGRTSARRRAQRERRETASFGMWVFIASETMFFGGLLFAYVYGRIRFPAGFAAASRATDVALGTANTALLLTSSFVVALAVAAASQRRRLTTPLLATAATLGLAFLVVKAIEYRQDWHEGFVPVPGFHLAATMPGVAPPPGAELFAMLYFTMTAVHALHLAIGIVWLGLLAWAMHRAPPRPESLPRLEVAGLYWHFVDVVWIFLYPLLYLVARAP